MARPSKQVVDYFPHYAASGKTIFILENKFGNDGYAFWFKLLELLASTEGHSFRIGNPTDREFLLAKTKVSEEKANEILNVLAELDAIDKELYDEKIIWSQNFVDNLADVYKKRIVSAPEKPDKNGFRTGNTNSIGVSDSGNPQSKVKERRVKKSIEKESIETEIFGGQEELMARLCEVWEKSGYGSLNTNTAEKLLADSEIFTEAWVMEAIGLGNERSARSYSYVKGILNSWQTKGKDAPKPTYSKGKEVKPDFTERQYDYSDLEKKLLGRE